MMSRLLGWWIAVTGALVVALPWFAFGTPNDAEDWIAFAFVAWFGVSTTAAGFILIRDERRRPW